MRRLRVCAALAAALSCFPLSGVCAQTPETRPASSPRALAVARSSTPIRLDGLLREPVWATADSIDDLRQLEPLEGGPVSERTVVRAARDQDALYVAVRCYDRQARAIVAAQLRRDADLSADDHVSVLIDGYRDHRGAVLMETNPNGALRDAEIGGFESTNWNWNGIWDVAVARDSAGWTAEFRLPFRTLRFQSSDDGVFGFNVRRFIARTNEQALWRGWRRTEGMTQLAAAGELTGLGMLRRAHGVELRPYALGRLVSDEHDVSGATVAPGSSGGKLGIDAKAALTPTLTADLTANTDFAQVEVDQQVINLTRFPTFFPEKREFFLEASSIFSFGTSEESELFYSRRIGLNEGVTVPILGGARVTGRQGGWRVGLLDVRTGGTENANDAVVRVQRDLFSRSWIGVMALDRSGPGVDGHQSAGGIDGQFPLVVRGRNVVPSFWVAGTHMPGTPGTPLAWRADLDYPNDLFDNRVSLSRIEPGFSPALGFVRRTGIWETTGHVDWMPRPGVLGIRRLEITPLPGWDIIAGEGGSLADRGSWQTAELEWSAGAEMQGGDELYLELQRELDAPGEPFDVFEGITIQPGRYWWTSASAGVETSQRRALSLGLDVSGGGFFDGHARAISARATWHGGGHVIAGLEAGRTRATLPAGSFVAIETAGRLEYALNTRAGLMAFVQYNNEDRRADFNLRLHWIPTIGDDVFLVWNSGYSTDPIARHRFPGTSAFKYPLNGALVLKAVHRFAP